MNEEEKEELKELINLMYNNHISQYGKRKLESYINTILDSYNQEKESHKIDNENYKILHDDITALAKYMGLEENAIIDEMYEAFDKEKEKNKKLEEELKSHEMVHNYDVKMIDEVKGEAVKLYKVIDMMAEELIQDGIFVNSNVEDVKEYYFKKARGEEDVKD